MPSRSWEESCDREKNTIEKADVLLVSPVMFFRKHWLSVAHRRDLGRSTISWIDDIVDSTNMPLPIQMRQISNFYYEPMLVCTYIVVWILCLCANNLSHNKDK